MALLAVQLMGIVCLMLITPRSHGQSDRSDSAPTITVSPTNPRCLSREEARKAIPTDASQYDIGMGKYARAPYSCGPHYRNAALWIYTEAFAKRFGMPKEWVSQELKGAEAVSFRAIPHGMRRCNWGGDPDACTDENWYVFTLYLKADAPIEWLDPELRQSTPLYWYPELRVLRDSEDGDSERFGALPRGAQGYFSSFECSIFLCGPVAMDRTAIKGMILYSFKVPTSGTWKNFRYVFRKRPADGKRGDPSLPVTHVITIPDDFMRQAQTKALETDEFQRMTRKLVSQ